MKANIPMNPIVRSSMNHRPFPISFVAALLTLLAVSTSSRAADRSGDFKDPIGLQLYTLRESFKTDVLGTLDKVKALGEWWP